MADAWRALAAVPGVSIKVVIEEKEVCRRGTAFDEQEVLRGLDAAVVREADAAECAQSGDWRALDSTLGDFAPDVAFVVGWHAKTCRRVATTPVLRGVPKVMCFDMPWQWRPRKIAARFVLARYLANFRAAFVPGAAAARYARWLGFKDVRNGLFSVDVRRFASAAPCKRRGFVYVGRNSDEKRLDLIREAHGIYRKRGGEWSLSLYGGGLDGGFLQPKDIPGVYASAGALVLASAFDPWPLVIAESCAAGLPVICSDRCGNIPELVRGNGRVVRYGSATALADAMAAAERGELHGDEGRLLVAPYSSEAWAKRVLEFDFSPDRPRA